MTEKKYNRFKSRAISFNEVREYGDWRFKVYSLTWDGSDINREAYEIGLAEAFAYLPTPTVTEKRPGVGFVICHTGKPLHYLVLCYWDNENECVARLLVCPVDDNHAWREAIDESFCVWDMEIMWHEREAYVRTLLSGREGEMVDEYLSMRFSS